MFKKIAFNTLLLSLASISFFNHSFAYKQPTHRLITKSAVTKATNYDNFLTTFALDKISANDYINDGSDFEDNNARYFNHFFDPFNNKGLNISGIQYGRLSKEWGLSGGNGFTFGPNVNDYSWTMAREYEYLGLTASTPTGRSTNINIMFQSIGQVLHLAQDLAQPSHTRNDPHASAYEDKYINLVVSPSHLEDWANLNENKIKTYSSTAGSSVASPINTYDGFFDYLANYSNLNFFSDDTIFEVYSNPSINETDYGTFTFNSLARSVVAEDGKIDKAVYLTKTGGQATGYKVAQAGYFAKELSIFNIFRLQFQIDDVVADENAAVLIPKAAELSAGILDYFFRGKIGVDPVIVGVRQNI